jgi:hypothetical protein
VPFAARPVWDVTPDGTIITGDGASYELGRWRIRAT